MHIAIVRTTKRRPMSYRRQAPTQFERRNANKFSSPDTSGTIPGSASSAYAEDAPLNALRQREQWQTRALSKVFQRFDIARFRKNSPSINSFTPNQ